MLPNICVVEFPTTAVPERPAPEVQVGAEAPLSAGPALAETGPIEMPPDIFQVMLYGLMVANVFDTRKKPRRKGLRSVSGISVMFTPFEHERVLADRLHQRRETETASRPSDTSATRTGPMFEVLIPPRHQTLRSNYRTGPIHVEPARRPLSRISDAGRTWALASRYT
jgi:hypothetical protein